MDPQCTETATWTHEDGSFVKFRGSPSISVAQALAYCMRDVVPAIPTRQNPSCAQLQLYILQGLMKNHTF